VGPSLVPLFSTPPQMLSQWFVLLGGQWRRVEPELFGLRFRWWLGETWLLLLKGRSAIARSELRGGAVVFWWGCSGNERRGDGDKLRARGVLLGLFGFVN
jgi:hypothetical protein